MYNIHKEHNYVILSSIIQLVNYMFRPLCLAIVRLYLAYCINSVSNGRRDLVDSCQVHELNRMVPIFAIYILCSTFWCVANKFVYTLLNEEITLHSRYPLFPIPAHRYHYIPQIAGPYWHIVQMYVRPHPRQHMALDTLVRRVICNTMTMTVQPRQQTTTLPSYLPIQ